MSAAPRVFISYAHADTAVARRLLRRLVAHGVDAWLDERQLRFGTALDTALREHITEADIVVVLASQKSADSKWVALELACALELEKPIVPLFLEALMSHQRFQNHKGLDVTVPQQFAAAIDLLLRDIHLTVGNDVPDADRAALTKELRDLAREEPALAPVILGCLDGEGLHEANLRTAFEVSFHPLDEALNALYDVEPSRRMADHAAYGFKMAGAGTRALTKWVAATGDGGLPLLTAVGAKLASPGHIPAAIELLTGCDPPNNQALYGFIDANAAQFDAKQRANAVRLVIWPRRESPEKLADVAALVALKAFPDDEDVKKQWIHWIRDGGFDSRFWASALARHFVNGTSYAPRAFEAIGEELASHVKSRARAGNWNALHIATRHMMAAADEKSPLLERLLYELTAAPGTAEWDDWRKRDAADADVASTFVREIAKQARGARDWAEAYAAAERARKRRKDD